MVRREHRPPTPTSSGKSRSVASYATERRSLEHDSDQTSQCHHANKLATLQSTTKQHAATICTICSHRSQILRAHAERQMSASAAVTTFEYGDHLRRGRCARAQARSAMCATRLAAVASRVERARSSEIASHAGPSVGRIRDPDAPV